jgi:hypothetical protein
MSRHQTFLSLAILALCSPAVPASAGQRGAAPPASPDRMEEVHRLVKPQPGESRWMEVPWLTSVWGARRQAAAEGKPVFIWAGSGGGPIGVC